MLEEPPQSPDIWAQFPDVAPHVPLTHLTRLNLKYFHWMLSQKAACTHPQAASSPSKTLCQHSKAQAAQRATIVRPGFQVLKELEEVLHPCIQVLFRDSHYFGGLLPPYIYSDGLSS